MSFEGYEGERRSKEKDRCEEQNETEVKLLRQADSLIEQQQRQTGKRLRDLLTKTQNRAEKMGERNVGSTP